MSARKSRSAEQMSFEFGGSSTKKANAAKKAKAAKSKPKATKVRNEKKAAKKKTPARTPSVKPKKTRRSKSSKAATAESMAAKQRAISISEFFAKNRHLLGFDNPHKALLTAVKEAVDNSLDACEEAHILPDLLIDIKQVSDKRYTLMVRDNGPGIVREQIPNIFARLLYGSKFHSLKMSRGQQGIGISAAGMYGLLTTGEPVQIVSRTNRKKPALHYHVQIDTSKNQPQIVLDEECDFDLPTGTKVTITLEGKYLKGKRSVDEYIFQTAMANPHATIIYNSPDDKTYEYKRQSNKLPFAPKEIKPHPYGVELGLLFKMVQDSDFKQLSAFLKNEFSRVSPRVAQQICDKAGLKSTLRPTRMNLQDAEKLHDAINWNQDHGSINRLYWPNWC